MISRVIGYKGLAIGSAALNVLVAAAVLPPALSLFYLSALSFAQVIIPFAGLGVSQTMVTMRPEDAVRSKAGRWYLLSFVLSLLLLGALYADSALAANGWPLLLIVGVMGLQLLAEWVRVARADQTGFLIANVVMLLIALQMLVTRSLDPAFPLPFIGLALLAWLNRDMLGIGSIPIGPDVRSLVRALLVASLNQFYNIVVIIATFVSASPQTLALVLTYRFAILFNWNNFYWLRFAHKSTAEAISSEHMRENRKYTALNFLSAFAAIAGLAAYHLLDLAFLFENAYIAEEALAAVAVFGLARAVSNCMFPYEIFLAYSEDRSRSAVMLAAAIISFLLIAILYSRLESVLVFLLFVELVALSWRLGARWWLRHDA